MGGMAVATYNLINSVKGGCGKTTFSLWLAYYLDKSLLIDMDLLGTSMQILFYGNTDVCKTAYTNDVFQGVRNSRKRFVEKVKLSTGRCMNVIFASMDYKEKDQFKAGKYSGYTPVVKHSIFRLGLRELLKHNRTIEGEDVEHFIFDMPPNSDGFSDAAMECIFNSRYSDLKREDRKNLFIMIGTDLGQTIATIQQLKTLLVQSDENEPDGIFLVINHNLGVDFGENDYENRKKKIEEALLEWPLTEKLTKKIYFLKMGHSEYYTKLGIEGKGLETASADKIHNAFLPGVISAYAEYQKPFKDIATDTNGEDRLRELILGKRADN